MTIEAPRYPVGTITDMARIPEEALPRFLVELPEMLEFIRPMNAIADAAKGALKLSAPAIWIDDDKREWSTSISLNGEELMRASGKKTTGEQP